MKNNLRLFTKISIVLAVAVVSLSACKKKNTAPEIEEELPKERSIYIPKEFATMDFNSSASTWSYSRSKQSEHFIIFWGAGYGIRNPNDQDVPELYRVDIDNLLKKAEETYDLNVNKLKFAEVGVGKSNLDKYKMIIYLSYTTDYIANGGGVDNVIGALWLSPNPVRPVGSVLAHEIGHSFQYQVYCDLKVTTGFRYGFGGYAGNTYWETTAQWQAQQEYPKEVFSAGQFLGYTQTYNKHIMHEDQRYRSYFTNFYWAENHGLDFIAKIWRQAIQPEDAILTYMRLTKINVEQFNDEVYDASKKFVTWDLDALRDNGVNYIGKHTYGFTSSAGGFSRVTYDKCPQTTGYNVVPLMVPGAGTVVTVDFKGLPNAAGFNSVDATKAGWRYGYVALLANGTRVYGDMAKGTQNQVSFTVPENCSKLWFVVTGAPTVYTRIPWDNITTNDEQWPYEVKFTNTNILGI